MRFLLDGSVFSGKLDMFMFAILTVVSTVLMIFVGYKLLQMLQLSGYKIKGYVKWFKETRFSYISRLFMLSFLSLSAMLITNVLLIDFFIDKIISYISVLFYVLFSAMFINNLFTAKQKTPLKYTKRMTRLVIVFTLFVGGFTWLIQYIGYKYVPYISFGLIGVIPVMLPIFVFLAYYVTYPIEKLISNTYIKKAKKKLESIKNIKVIGITGSYGKTSVKNILNTILSEKYKVCASPSSYNTPLGISKTILSKLNEDDEILIAEMGARQQNDILELCEMVKPSVGIITGIGNQHLLTFGSIENIIKTKCELADYICDNNGELFVNIDNEITKTAVEKYQKANLCSIKNKASKLEVFDIKTSMNGSVFKLKLDDEVVECNTILLGNHNISNILVSAEVALSFGLSLKEIASGISKLVSIKHRLEIVKSSSSYTIIDDAFNSSVEGAKASLDVLSKFDGNKFVITPGLVELGINQYQANFDFGNQMAGVCDYVIIDSVINYEAIKNGLIDAGFEEFKIIKTTTLLEAVEKLSELATYNDVVLFENDLPDNYS